MSLSDDASPQPHWETVRPVLDDALQDLDERERLPVILRFFGQQSFSAIGQQLGLSENAAQKRVDRALDLLNSALAKRGIASTAALLGASLTHAAVTAPAALAATVANAALAGTAAPAAAGFFGLSALATKTLAASAAAVVVATGAAFAWQTSAGTPTETPAAVVTQAAPLASVLVPPSPTAAPQAPAPATALPKVAPVRLPAQILYMVQRSDTAEKISTLWHVTPERLIAVNPVYDFSLMRAGDQVVIPPEGYVADSVQLNTNVYVVIAGDTLPRIVAKTGVSIDQLRAVNPSINWARLRVGQSIKLP